MSPIYASACTCGSVQALARIEQHRSDAEAAAAFSRRRADFHVNDGGRAVDHRWRYWCVHGPGGHVIAVR